MQTLFIVQGGRTREIANFLSGLMLNEKETVVLSSKKEKAIESAKIIKDALNFRVKEYGWLNFNGSCDDDQIRHKISNWCPNRGDIKTIIVISGKKEVEKTLGSYDKLFNPKTTGFDTVVKEGSVHRVGTLNYTKSGGQKIEEIFTPS